MEMQPHWENIRRLAKDSFRSSLHFALASVNADGSPHITPIGSLILGKDGKAFYFEIFTAKMRHNFEKDARICVLAVNSSRWLWFKALLRGQFATPPALRLIGTVGERRAATPQEIALWEKRVRLLRWMKGYDRLWGNLAHVREIQFTACEPVHLGSLTSHLWK
jgi:hypothetical protein